MNFIALLLVAFALFANLKAYPNVFMGKKKRAENEKKFYEAYEEMDKKQVGEGMIKGVAGCVLYLTLFFSFVLFLITSIVINNPFMYALAVIIFLLEIIIIKDSKKAVFERKFAVSKIGKISLPLKTVYIIGFIILFFI